MTSTLVTPYARLSAEMAWSAMSGTIQAYGANTPLSSVSDPGITGAGTVLGSTVRFGKWPDPAGRPRQVFRHAMRQSDPFTNGGQRVDIVLEPQRLYLHKTYWAAFEMYWPSGNVWLATDNQTFFNIHPKDGGVGNATFQFDLQNFFANNGPAYVRVVGGVAPNLYTYIPATDMPPDRWLSVIVQYQLSPGSDGFARVWVNGKIVKEDYGPNAYDEVYPYTKFAFYQTSGYSDAGHDEREMFYGEIFLIEDAGFRYDDINALFTYPTPPEEPERIVDNVEVCQRSGFEVPRGTLQRQWDGRLVRPKSMESRHPLDLLKSSGPEQPKGSRAPEGADAFIAEYGMQFVLFDGTTRLRSTAALPALPSTGLTFAAWVTPFKTSQFTNYLCNWVSTSGSGEFRVPQNQIGGNNIELALFDGTTALNLQTAATLTTADNGRNVALGSVNFSTGEAVLVLVKRGIAGLPVTATTVPLDPFGLFDGLGNFYIGSDIRAVSAAVGLIYVADAWTDFSVAANRALFVNAQGLPVTTLPADPKLIYFGNQQSVASWNAAANQGSLTGFTRTGSEFVGAGRV